MSSSKGGEANDSSSNYSKNWELNIYELNRIPHEIIHDDTEIAVSPKILQNELMCPICLDILKNTMTTKECLHRFCHDCIITALRAGNKECPTCRKKLVSKRSLRPDPNFDGIIAKIYPNREEYDALHEKVLEKLNKKHLTALNGSATNGHKGARQQRGRNNTTLNSNDQPAVSSEPPQQISDETPQTTLPQQDPTQTNNSNPVNGSSNAEVQPKQSEPSITSRANKRPAQLVNNSDDSDMESRASTEQSSLQLQNDPDELELVLKPHPTKETSLNSNRFLKTTANASINHLAKYLWTRLCVEAPGAVSSSNPLNASLQPTVGSVDDFQIFISGNEKSPSSFQLLNPNFSLEQVIDKYWKQNRPLELFYHLKPASGDLNGANSNGSTSHHS